MLKELSEGAAQAHQRTGIGTHWRLVPQLVPSCFRCVAWNKTRVSKVSFVLSSENFFFNVQEGLEFATWGGGVKSGFWSLDLGTLWSQWRSEFMGPQGKRCWDWLEMFLNSQSAWCWKEPAEVTPSNSAFSVGQNRPSTDEGQLLKVAGSCPLWGISSHGRSPCQNFCIHCYI